MIMRIGGAQVAILEFETGCGNFAKDGPMNGVVGVSFLQNPYMLGKFHSFCECVFTGKEGVLANPLFEGAFALTDAIFSGLILACENFSAAYSDRGKKAIAM